MGLTMVTVAIIGCTACCRTGKGRRYVLNLLYYFTLGILIVSACSFGFGMEYARIITYASTHGFIDSPEGNGPIYRGIMKGYRRAFDKCEPVAYRTDDLITACRAKERDILVENETGIFSGRECDDIQFVMDENGTATPANVTCFRNRTGTYTDEDVEALQMCQDTDPDKVYIYCRGTDRSNGWARTTYNSGQEAAIELSQAGNFKFPAWATIKDNRKELGHIASSFDWWMSRICMPNTTEFERATRYTCQHSQNCTLDTEFPEHMGEPSSGVVTSRRLAESSDDLVDNGRELAEGINGQVKSQQELYDECWNSTWFARDELKLGQDVYSWMPEIMPLSNKQIFCFCASSPQAQEELWDIVVKYASYGKWLALTMTIFFFITWLSETYLIIFQKDKLNEYMDAASQWQLRTGGIRHDKSELHDVHRMPHMHLPHCMTSATALALHKHDQKFEESQAEADRRRIEEHVRQAQMNAEREQQRQSSGARRCSIDDQFGDISSGNVHDPNVEYGAAKAGSFQTSVF